MSLSVGAGSRPSVTLPNPAGGIPGRFWGPGMDAK